MKHIHDLLINGNRNDAIEALYALPLTEYAQLLFYCVENPELGRWIALQLELMLDDKAHIMQPCGDKRQFRCTEEAVGKLNGNQPTAAMLRLTYGAKKRTNRLIRRSIRLSGQMIFRHGISGIDKLIDACNTGLEDD